MYGQVSDAYKIPVGKHEGKKPLRTYKDRWENMIKMDVKQVRYEIMNCIIWLGIGTM
jgi:hypothetical protein